MATKKTDSKRIEDKQLYNSDAERALLSAIFLAGDEAGDIIAETKIQYFYDKRNRLIFKAMENLSEEGGVIDMVTLTTKLETQNLMEEIGGATYLTQVITSVRTHVNYAQYLSIISKLYTLREIVNVSHQNILEATSSDDASLVLAKSEERLLNIGGSLESESCEHVKESVYRVMNKFESILNNEGYQPGIKTGYKKIDKILMGFKPSQFIVIAARPGCGKTSMALDIVCNNIRKANKKEDIHVIIFNMEMSADELTEKMAYNLSGVPRDALYQDIQTNTKAFSNIFNATSALATTNIFIDDTAGITVEEIAARCRRYKRKYRALDFVVVDYLQLISTKSKRENRQQEVAEISRGLKILAKTLKVPVIVLSQLSRSAERRDDGKIVLSDLRDSGAIEQDADVVMFLSPHQDEEGEEDEEFQEVRKITASIAKNRNGRVGETTLNFQGALSKFTDVDVYEETNIVNLKKTKDAYANIPNPEPIAEIEEVPNIDNF